MVSSDRRARRHHAPPLVRSFGRHRHRALPAVVFAVGPDPPDQRNLIFTLRPSISLGEISCHQRL
jgi:hypothetical protein